MFVRVGDVVRTAECWGESDYLKFRCGVCRAYMKREVNPTCGRCGTSYREISEGFHEVVSRG